MTAVTLVTRVAQGTLALSLAATGVALSGTTLPVATASAAQSSESYAVPDSGRFQLSGLGFGHGIGMSQFGAEGMGRLGKSYRQILNFYYPGTSYAKTSPDRAIRVLLTGVTRYDFGRSAVLVRPRSNLRVVNDGRTIQLPAKVAGGKATGYRVLASNSGLQVRAYRGGTSKRVVAGLHGVVRFATSHSQGNSRVTLVASSGSTRTYRGFLDVRRGGTGLMSISNVLLQHYLRSVVSAEVPSSWTPAALRAQAVAARSYALLAQQTSRSDGRAYDICDTTSCQVYGTVGAETSPEVAAVKATARVYLRSGKHPAFTQFSSANGGYSVAGSRSYLVAKPDPYDRVVTGDANWGHSWDQTVTAGGIERAWPQIGSLKTLKVLGRDGNGRWGGRVQTVALVGSKQTVRVSADSFRWGLGLKSTWWTVTNVASTSKTAPRHVRGEAQDRAVRVRWGAPNTDKTIRGYRITASPGDHTVRVGAKDRAVKVGGLTNGREYRARVRAVYGGGPGPARSTPVFVPRSS